MTKKREKLRENFMKFARQYPALSLRQIAVLAAVEATGEIRINELAMKLDWPQSSVSRAVARLDRDVLVCRRTLGGSNLDGVVVEATLDGVDLLEGIGL